MIKLNNVNKYFFKGRSNEIHVIDDVTMELPDRGMVALYGKSGCGKTTLLNTIGGLDSFRSGSIEVDGQNINKHTDLIRNKYVGYIFQNYNLNMLVNNFENVAESLRLCGMTDEEEIKTRVIAALTGVGMDKYIYRMPDTLSGGQKQRIAIARAIVKNPAIILADEPTGNLDEANTIMIMDLLRSFSREHLVLIVTHESNLVDYYCDKVIELSDGKVMNVRENSDANGYTAREKNVVYLGELEKNETDVGRTKLVCYGPEMPEDLVIRLVNSNGRILLKCDSPRVSFIDESSEIVFNEGKFEEQERRNRQESVIDMSALPAFEGKNYGRLFRFSGAVRTSVKQLRGRKSKGNSILKRGISLFTVILVLLAAVYGNNIKSLMEASESYNHNTFYVYANTPEKIDLLYKAAENREKGIDSVIMKIDAPFADVEYDLNVDIFESFSYRGRYSFPFFGDGIAVSGHGVYLQHELADGLALLNGTKELTADNETVISSCLADILIKNSNMSFIDSRDDLIGLGISGGSHIPLKIRGIVESDEPAAYVSTSFLYAGVASLGDISSMPEYSEDLADDEVRVLVNDPAELGKFKVGDELELKGRSFKIKEVVDPISESLSPMMMEMLQKIRDGYQINFGETNEERFYVELTAPNGTLESYEVTWEEFITVQDLAYGGAASYCVSEKVLSEMTEAAAREGKLVFAQVHASNLAECERFLRDNFTMTSTEGWIPYDILTPDDLYHEATDTLWENIAGALGVMTIYTGLLCLCVYIIMRGSVMSRVKEIGVYRCIGVTKANMNFKFMVEGIMLSTFAMLPSFLVMVGAIHFMLHHSGVMLNFFLPWWICLPMLLCLYIITVVCSMLPCIGLMSKTPAAIIAKYDI